MTKDNFINFITENATTIDERFRAGKYLINNELDNKKMRKDVSFIYLWDLSVNGYVEQNPNPSEEFPGSVGERKYSMLEKAKNDTEVYDEFLRVRGLKGRLLFGRTVKRLCDNIDYREKVFETYKQVKPVLSEKGLI